jgi:hypothetical protein
VKPAIFGVSVLSVVLLGPVCLAADEAGKAEPSGGAAAAQTASDSGKSAKPQTAKGQPRASGLTKPWRDLGSLTEEQQKQIADIHRKAVQDRNVIKEREEADIMALLNDQQKGEVKAMREKETAEKKARAANRPSAKGGSGGQKAAGEKSADGKSGEKEAAGQTR